jgi:hypothetical protein
MTLQQRVNPLFVFIQELHQHPHAAILNKGFNFKLEEQQNYCGFEISSQINNVADIFDITGYTCAASFVGVGQASELNNNVSFHYVETYKPLSNEMKFDDSIINLIVNFNSVGGLVNIEGHYYPSKKPVKLTPEIANKLQHNYAGYFAFMLFVLQLRNVKIEKIINEMISLQVNLFSMFRKITSKDLYDDCREQC